MYKCKRGGAQNSYTRMAYGEPKRFVPLWKQPGSYMYRARGRLAPSIKN
jgi:hypothetical protein